MIVTSSSLISLCQKLGALSSNQAGLSAQDILTIANLVQTTLVAEILQAREEFLIYTEKVPVEANAAIVRIPYRAVNGVVRHLWYEDPIGARFRLSGRAIEDIEDYQPSARGQPNSFYAHGNNIVLLPTPIADGSLVFAYPFRPNLLVESSQTQTIQTVGSSTLTVANVPSTFANGAAYDIIDNTSGNGIIAYDLTGYISGNTISFTDPLPGNVLPGNYIARAGQSPVPMLPEEAHPLLLETTVMRVEMVRGNAARVKNSGVVIQDARKSFDLLLNNRMISKAHPTGGGGMLRAMRPF